MKRTGDDRPPPTGAKPARPQQPANGTRQPATERATRLRGALSDGASRQRLTRCVTGWRIAPAAGGSRYRLTRCASGWRGALPAGASRRRMARCVTVWRVASRYGAARHPMARGVTAWGVAPASGAALPDLFKQALQVPSERAAEVKRALGAKRIDRALQSRPIQPVGGIGAHQEAHRTDDARAVAFQDLSQSEVVGEDKRAEALLSGKHKYLRIGGLDPREFRSSKNLAPSCLVHRQDSELHICGGQDVRLNPEPLQLRADELRNCQRGKGRKVP